MAGNPNIPGGAGGLVPEGGGDLAKGANEQVGKLAGRSASDTGDTAKDAAAESSGSKGPTPGPEAGGALAQAGGTTRTASGSDGGKKGGADEAAPLGAGGTSEAGDDGGKGSNEGLSGGKLGKGAVGAAAVPAAGAAAQLMVLMIFLKLLKGFMLMLGALMANLWNLIWGAIVTAAKAVVGFFMGIGSAVANVFGGAVSAVSSAVLGGGIFFLSGLLAVGGIGSAVAQRDGDTAQRDGGAVVSCEADAQQAMSKVGGDEPVTGDNVENAKRVYSVFSAWGMPDETIAGILGNWEAESSIDPTQIETIYGKEMYTWGPYKQSIAANTNFEVMKLAPSYAAQFPGVAKAKYVGIGVEQWTGEGNTKLRAFADSIGKPWYELDTQLAFFRHKDNPDGDTSVLFRPTSMTPGQAAEHFAKVYERPAASALAASLPQRTASADKYFSMMATWQPDQSLADSILKQAAITVDNANESRRKAIQADCRGAESKGSAALAKGGMTQEEAQKVIDLYLKEGDSFLDGRYGSGGPGSCGDDHAMNCVSFSTYFVNKYTSFQQYAPGDGVNTAGVMASMMGKKTSHTPTAYSVASGPGSGPAGHTFVVLGVTDKEIILGEAGYCSNRGGVRAMPIEEATSGKWEYVDVTDLMLPPDKVYTS